MDSLPLLNTRDACSTAARRTPRGSGGAFGRNGRPLAAHGLLIYMDRRNASSGGTWSVSASHHRNGPSQKEKNSARWSRASTACKPRRWSQAPVRTILQSLSCLGQCLCPLRSLSGRRWPLWSHAAYKELKVSSSQRSRFLRRPGPSLSSPSGHGCLQKVHLPVNASGCIELSRVNHHAWFILPFGIGFVFSPCHPARYIVHSMSAMNTVRCFE